MKENLSIQFSQTLSVRDTVNITVVGGGLAGVCAACTAAMSGHTVLLIEQYATLGGMGSTGGVGGFCGETEGAGQIFDEILADLDLFKSLAPYSTAKDFAYRGRAYNHEILPFVLQELVLKYKVKLLLHTRVTAVMKGNKGLITHLIIAGSSGLEAIQTEMVIDCTGDGTVGGYAGCEIMKGDPKNGYQLPMSFMAFMRSPTLFAKRHSIPAGYFPGPMYKNWSDLPMVSYKHLMSGNHSVKIKVPMYDATDTGSLSDAEIEARRKFMRVLSFDRKHWRPRWVVSHTSPTIGIREGQRIVGLYVLILDDVRAGRNFHDAVAVGTYSLDAHKPDDDKRTYILPTSQLNIPPYHIPLRCLISKDCPNLLMAGRNLSADQLAMSSARVMPTCAQMGEAAGIVAALSLKDRQLPKYYTENEEQFKPVAEKLDLIKINRDLAWYQSIKAQAKYPAPKVQLAQNEK